MGFVWRFQAVAAAATAVLLLCAGAAALHVYWCVVSQVSSRIVNVCVHLSGSEAQGWGMHLFTVGVGICGRGCALPTQQLVTAQAIAVL